MTPTATPDAGPITIGLLYNLTGVLAPLDGPALQGSQLAVQQINDRGGINGRPVEVVLEDAQSDVQLATDAATRLAQNPDVDAVIGLTDPAQIEAAAQVLQQAGVPMLEVGATEPGLGAIGNFIFMVPMGDNTQAGRLAEFAATEQQLFRAALLTDEDQPFTTAFSDYFVQSYTQLGGEVATQQTYSTGIPSLALQIEEILALDPPADVLVVSAIPDDVGVIVALMRESGLTMPILGSNSFDTPLLVEIAGLDAANGVFFTTHFGIYSGNQAVRKFSDAYRREYGVRPENVYAGLGYDAVNLLAESIERAGFSENDKVQAALAETTEFVGVTGTATYANGSGVPLKSVALIEVIGGEFTPHDTIVPDSAPDP